MIDTARRVSAGLGRVGSTDGLTDTFARLAPVNPYLTITTGIPDDREWTSLAELFDPATGRFAQQWGMVGDWYKTDIPEVIARFLGGGIIYAVAAATVGAFAQDRRVPDLSPDNVWLSFADWGSPNAVAFANDRFAGLPTDPVAGSPEIEIIPTVDALRDELRSGLIEIFSPLIGLLRSRARIGARSLWIGAAESCAHAILTAIPTNHADDETWVRSEVDALICQADSPLYAQPDLALIDANGRCRLCLIGATCCENFKRPGESYCANCPHRRREERVEALRDWIADLPG